MPEVNIRGGRIKARLDAERFPLLKTGFKIGFLDDVYGVAAKKVEIVQIC